MGLMEPDTLVNGIRFTVREGFARSENSEKVMELDS